MNEKTKKHLTVIIVTIVLTLILEYVRTSDGWELKMHTWNKAFGDLSIVYIIITLSIGSLIKINPSLYKLSIWARPIGIWSMVLALLHIIIVIGGWDDWNIWWLLGFSPIRDGSVQFNMPGFSFANIVGLIAALYGIAALITSNDSSIKKLGFEGWKYLQQRSVHMLYILGTLHTFYFLYFFYYTYGRETPPPNFFITLFPFIVVPLLVLQTIAFVKVIKNNK